MINTKLVLSSLALTLIATDRVDAYQTQQNFQAKSRGNSYQNIFNNSIEIAPSVAEASVEIAQTPVAPLLVAAEPKNTLYDRYGMQFISMPLVVESNLPQSNTAMIPVNASHFNGVSQHHIPTAPIALQGTVQLSHVSSARNIPASFMERSPIAVQPEQTPVTPKVAAKETKPTKIRSVNRYQMQFIDSPLITEHITSQPRFGKKSHTALPGLHQVSLIEDLPANCNHGTMDSCTL